MWIASEGELEALFSKAGINCAFETSSIWLTSNPIWVRRLFIAWISYFTPDRLGTE